MVKNINEPHQLGVERTDQRGLTLAWDQLQVSPDGRLTVRILDFGSSGFRSAVLIQAEPTSVERTVRLPM